MGTKRRLRRRDGERSAVYVPLPSGTASGKATSVCTYIVITLLILFAVAGAYYSSII